MHLKKTLRIGTLEISPPLAVAPMVGLSHSALRSVIYELGGAGLFFTEMLSAKRLPHENENISPCLIKSQSEHPLFYQIFLSESSVIVPALNKLHSFSADGVDINLGCPAPNLLKNGAGCALTKNHHTIREIIGKVRSNTKLPLTVKIRLGETLNQSRYLELCRIVEGEGADCLTVHARLNNEKFCRKPRWEWIGRAKESVKIPVIANGGIISCEDAKNCLDISGADGLMIGRGAAEAPWIFSEIASTLYQIPKKSNSVSLMYVYFRFASLLQKRFSKERRLGRLKQFTHYYAKSFKFGHRLATVIQNSSTMEEALEHASVFFNKYDRQIN
jgi:nifR3 family TIM-barrel protein